MGVEAPIEHDLRWPVVSLAEIATKIGSGATPTGGADAYLPSRARFALVRSQNVFDRRFDHDGLAFISDEQADGLRGVVLQPHDILLNITGDGITFGRACMVPKDVLPACVNQHVSIIRLDPQRADAGYVLAFLTHPEVKSYIESFNAGGSRRAVTKGHIESFRLPLPPLSEQRAIGDILDTFDNKIELNRRMNETLEAIARLLFKSWFVDFDPVRAKVEGHDSGLPSPIANLFPDSFEDSELGEIPTGWEVCGLNEIARFLNGLALQKYPPKNGRSLPVIKIAQLRAGNTNGADSASADLEADYIVEDGDVLFSWSGSLECILWAGGRGALNQHLFKVTSTDYPKWLYYLWIHQHLSDFRHIAAAKATTMGHIQRHHLSQAKVLLPPQNLLSAVDQYIRPLIEAIPKNRTQIRTLENLRNLLLPKLISGGIRIEDVTRIVGGNA
jgi:type I restriction enzyme S subunit